MPPYYSTIINELFGYFGLHSERSHGLVCRICTFVESTLSQSRILKRLIRLLRLEETILKTRLTYDEWVAINDTLSENDTHLIQQHIGNLTVKPRISIIILIKEHDTYYMQKMINSLKMQLYDNWDAYIVIRLLDRASDQKLSDYRSIVSQLSNTNLLFIDSIFNLNELLLSINSDFISIIESKPLFKPESLYLIATSIINNPYIDILYFDEDIIDIHGKRHSPNFRPDWSPDLLNAINYLYDTTVYRAALIRAIAGLREDYSGGELYDLVLRSSEKTCDSKIRHIPFILYHRYAECERHSEQKAVPSNQKALKDHLLRLETPATISTGQIEGSLRVRFSLSSPSPLISIIIPTCGSSIELFRNCINGIINMTDYPNWKLNIVTNNLRSTEVLDLVKPLLSDNRICLLHYDRSFNFSDIYNFAVPRTKGELLGILNDDLDVIGQDWLAEMASQAMRPDIGAVGAKLYYPNDTIQHGGVLLGRRGVADHFFSGLPRNSKGYQGRALLTQNVSAVTAACMVLRRAVFEEVGGFDVNLAVAYNDVDLCLRIRQKGYRILWTPFAELYHMESISRGSDSSKTAYPRYLKEKKYMQDKWGEVLLNDPYYNPNLSLLSDSFEPSPSPRTSKPWHEELTPLQLQAPSVRIPEKPGQRCPRSF